MLQYNSMGPHMEWEIARKEVLLNPSNIGFINITQIAVAGLLYCEQDGRGHGPAPVRYHHTSRHQTEAHP